MCSLVPDVTPPSLAITIPPHTVFLSKQLKEDIRKQHAQLPARRLNCPTLLSKPDLFCSIMAQALRAVRPARLSYDQLRRIVTQRFPVGVENAVKISGKFIFDLIGVGHPPPLDVDITIKSVASFASPILWAKPNRLAQVAKVAKVRKRGEKRGMRSNTQQLALQSIVDDGEGTSCNSGIKLPCFT